jgi:hypothetical protein
MMETPIARPRVETQRSRVRPAYDEPCHARYDSSGQDRSAAQPAAGASLATSM